LYLRSLPANSTSSDTIKITVHVSCELLFSDQIALR